MAAPNNIDVRELAEEDQAPAEQILANALQLYAALPAQARAATLAALRSPDPAAHGRLIREVVRTILKVQLQEHRESMLRAAGSDDLPSESPVDLAADEAFGQETVELIKQSRERRAGLQR